MAEATATPTATSTDSTVLGADANATTPTPNPTPESTTVAAEVPTEYKFNVPDGALLDPAAVEQASTVFRDLKLSNEQAQKIVDLQIGMQKQQIEAFESLKMEWAQEISKDPVVGGAKHAENVEMARRVVQRLEQMDPGLKLRDVLNDTGMGNNPALVRAFFQISKLLSEDKTTAGQPASPQPRRPEEILYKNTPTA